ncbi:glycosyltransferase [Chryseobacterium sp. ISL-6]|uniref:glycosyltransferase n=1 Tax=Chryseobacterium sp. ISL-6 TaxID=2819143 RepID=UPI001BEC0A69|nr:glycosyltransferase [Chryseobacterium sp. ISL-6]MBT2623506.1 glycosyltransferase [Chryseobacterium sp. ISL-6]
MKVSVALCTYNGEKYLSQQLESILKQSQFANEIIICDDNSTDSTIEILSNYKNQYPSIIKIFRNEVNVGYIKNFEKAINLCSYDLIFLSDQDDIWSNNKIQKVRDFAENNPDYNIFSHKVKLLKENVEIIESPFWKGSNFNEDFNNTEVLQYLLFERNVFPGMTLIITQDAKKNYLPFKNVHPVIIHDYELVLKSCRDEKFAIIPEALSLYRIHENQSIGLNSQGEHKSEKEIIYNKIKRIYFVVNAVHQLNLNPKLITEYKEKCRHDYKKFIKNIKFPKNLIMSLKFKYYYKILDDII